MALSSRKKRPLVLAGQSASGKAQSQRANNLERLVWAHQQAPSTYFWFRASACELCSHGRTSCYSSRQFGHPEERVSYAAALAELVDPFQPSRSLKPTAMDSYPFEPTVSSETVNRLMSSDMSGSLSETPDGTTTNAKVNNACLPAGELPNKTPIFISGVLDTRALLA